MLHAEPLSAQARLAENDQALPGRDHLLHVMQVEPAQDERLAQGVRFAFLQGGFEDLLSATEAIEARLDHFAAKANRLLAFFARKSGELPPVFMPARIMREQVAHCLEAETAQLSAARLRNPRDFA